jgi:hypothetical protein
MWPIHRRGRAKHLAVIATALLKQMRKRGKPRQQRRKRPLQVLDPPQVRRKKARRARENLTLEVAVRTRNPPRQNKKMQDTELLACYLLVFAFILLLQLLACTEREVPARKPGNTNKCSG